MNRLYYRGGKAAIVCYGKLGNILDRKLSLYCLASESNSRIEVSIVLMTNQFWSFFGGLAPGEVIYFLSGLDEEITSKSALERAYQSLCCSDYTDKSALGKYFVQKISRLREELDQGYIPNDQSYVLDDSDVNSDSTIPPTRIEAFELLAEDEVRVLIANSRSTSCCLDPIPTHLLKSCSESLISVITNIQGCCLRKF